MVTIADLNDIDQALSRYQFLQQRISHVGYKTDAFLSRDEFDYLTELRSGDILTEVALKKACLYLFAKKKFKHIILTLDSDQNSCRIFFDITAYWTFDKAVVSGILFGKEEYISLYGMETGEMFEELKHKHALQKLLERLKSDGYAHARIQSTFLYNYISKSITVRLHLMRGKQFKISKVDIRVVCDATEAQQLLELQRVLRSLFVSKLKDRSYKKYKLERVVGQMVSYLEQEGYIQSTVELEEKLCYKDKKVDLSYTVTVGPYRQFVFFGNAFFSKKNLLNTIMELGKSAWLVPASILAQEIVQAYKDKGFLNVVIDTQEEKNKCIFLIKEGRRLAVSDINIKNCVAYDAPYLVKSFFKKTLKKSYFDYEIFQKERNDLRDFYIKNGYLDIQIFDYTVTNLSKKKSGLEITLDEGKRSIIQEITIKDSDISSSELLDNSQPVHLTNEFIALQREEVQRLFKEKYKHDYNAFPEIKKMATGSVALEWNVRPVYVPKNFGKTVILASIDIPFKKIMKENAFLASQQWDNDLLRETFNRLKELDVFDTVFLSSKKLDIYGKEFVAARLQYDDPYEVQVRTGLELKNASYKRFFGEGIGYKLGGSFIIKNPLKMCDVFRCDIDMARFHYELGAEYRYPWVFNIPLRGMIKVYATKHDQPAFVGSQEGIYTVYHNGLLAGLHKNMGSVDYNINIGFDWGKTVIENDVCDSKGCFFEVARAINFKPVLLDLFIPYFFIEPTLYMDYLDNKMNPRKGSMTIASFKGMVPLSYAKKPSYFVKLLVEQSFFWPIKAVVGALRIRFGHIFHKDFSCVMPTQRFYLGGSQSLRGYDRDMAPPLGVYIDEQHKKGVVPRGSKSMINVNAELRIPLPSKWGLVLFQDFGTLADDMRAHLNVDNMLAATGFGVRYQTPVGPLRFDIGWKWFCKPEYEKSYGWYLAIGNAF